KDVTHHGVINATSIGDDQAIALALKELQAELGLERLDLMAHRALSDAEFLGSAREASVPRRGIERPQRVQRWQGAAHSAPLYMNKIGSGPRNDALPAAGRCSHLSAPQSINGAKNVDTEPARRARFPPALATRNSAPRAGPLVPITLSPAASCVHASAARCARSPKATIFTF